MFENKIEPWKNVKESVLINVSLGVRPQLKIALVAMLTFC